MTGHGSERRELYWWALWTLLERTQAVDTDRRAPPPDYVVTARDGYAAVLALAEIAPKFEGK
ncbi:MAG: hypothetical protein JO110_05010 [Acetobacteraceae bacterium]|nr:hypothetical protein [Acetobacteraceae bacterium]